MNTQLHSLMQATFFLYLASHGPLFTRVNTFIFQIIHIPKTPQGSTIPSNNV